MWTGYVHTTPETFKNGIFTLKTHQLLKSTLLGEFSKRDNKHNANILDLCLRKTRTTKSRDDRDDIRQFLKILKLKYFSSALKRKASRFQIPPV